MKKFTVMSRNAARRFSFGNIEEKTIIISITDVCSENNRFHPNPNIVGICEVKFDDVEKGEQFCITKKDAEKIVNFVRKNEDVDNIIVHCEAGVSRSAGCCAAIMLVYNGSDMEIFSNPRFCPNMTVYRTVLNAFMGEDNGWIFPEEEATEKEKISIENWKKANDIE